MEGGDKNIVMLSSDMLGDIKAMPGTMLTFCVTKKPDSMGNVAGYFKMGGGEEGMMPGETGDWNQDLRDAVSPRTSGDDAQ